MIPLYFTNGQAFVWNSDDWLKLRNEHRIVGELIGTIASQPRQDVYQGLPMVLMSEETAILVEQNLAQLVENIELTKPPTDDIKKIANESENRIYNEQIDFMKEKRLNQLSSKIDLIAAGKQIKLAKEGKSCEINKEELLKEELAKLPSLAIENSLVQIPNEHPWPSERADVSIDRLLPSLTSETGTIRYKVFKDLWKRGHYITAGTKFGGDFLVYLGDPTRFHAAFIIKCLKNKFSELALAEIVAFGRLGVSVNKLSVYAYVCDESVKYQTVQWYETLNKIE